MKKPFNAFLNHPRVKEYILKGKDGYKIHYWTNRLSKKPTIIFIHGLSGSAGGWVRYIQHFHKKYNVIVLDHRGHGFSFRPTTKEGYAIHEFAEDVYRVLQEEKIKKCNIVSHSFGTLVTLDFLQHHQNIVEKAILASASHKPSAIKGSKLLNPLIKFGLLINYLPQWKKTGGHVDYCGFINTGDWNVRRTITDTRNTGIRTCLNSYETVRLFDATNELKKINIPILLIHGKKDTMFPINHMKPMVKMLPNAKLHIMPKADHIIVLNHHIQFIKLIEDFLR